MKVLVSIFEQLVPISGGGTPRTHSIIRSFVERGHEVYVACTIGVPRAEALQTLGCHDLLALPGVSRMDRRKMQKYMAIYPWNIARTVAYARRKRPDLYVSHNSVAGFAAIAAQGLNRHGAAMLDLTDLLFEYLEEYSSPLVRLALAVGRRMETVAAQRSDRVITISRAMSDILASRYGVDEARVDVVHDGVDTNVFHDVDGQALRNSLSPEAEHVCVFHGVIDPQDRPELLVDAAPHILERHPRTAFWLVGDGTAAPTLKALVRDRGLADRFYFSGWIPQAEVARYISASDLGLVVLPDILSARGRVTLKEFEYWACGVPAVLPRLPALTEVVPDGEASRFYRPGDAQDFAQQVCLFLDDDARRRRMGERGRQLVRSRFEWRRLTDQLVTICEGYVAAGKADQGT